MSTLFDTDDTATAPDLATTPQVRLLEGFGYRTDAVRKWTKEKAETVLRNCRREQRIVEARCARLAGEQDGAVPAGTFSLPERITTAVFIEQAMTAGTADDLTQALSYSVHTLTNGETRRLAGYLVAVLKGPHDHRPEATTTAPRADAPPPDETVDAPGGP